MSTRSILAAGLLAAGLAGCGQPYHKQMTDAAKLRINTVNSRLNYDQAEGAFETGQFEKALEQINRAIELTPDNAGYHLLQARVYIETHRLEQASESLRAALERDPKLAKAHYFSGIVSQRWSDDQKAYEAYLTAYELEPSSVQYLLAAAESLVALGRLDQARAMVEPKLAYFEHNAALRHLLGEIALLQGDPAQAAEYLEEAWMFNPEDALLLEELAQAQYAAGLHGKCHKSIKQLQDLKGRKDPGLLHFEARCLAHMERLKEARGIYLELTGLSPTDPGLWVDFGTLAWELGDFHRVALCGARLAALAPERYEGYLLKGINEHHHGNLPEAVSLLREAVDRGEEEPMAWLVLGRVLQDSGDRQGALEAYGRVLRLDPANADAAALFAELSQVLEQEEEKLVTVPPSGQPR